VLPTYDVTCILFSYANEKIDTGIPEIDQIQIDFSTNILDYAILDEGGTPLLAEDGNYLVLESYGDNLATLPADNVVIQDEQTSNNVLSWSELDPFSEHPY